MERRTPRSPGRAAAAITGFGPPRFEWMGGPGEGPRPGQAQVTGKPRLAWLAVLVLVVTLALLLAVAA